MFLLWFSSSLIWPLSIASVVVQHTPLLNELEPCVAENVKETDHYICSDDHQVICLNGWSNPENSCRTPVCEFLTHDTFDADGDGDVEEITTKTCDHGDCVRPSTCACEVGWEGIACDECIRMPGCREGFCTEAFGCTCHNETMWTGALCDCPVCRDGCANGYCNEPGECICHEGWTGALCDECVTMPGCVNGGCGGLEHLEPLGCVCHPGWTGPLCDCPICSDDCNLDHGYCTNSQPNKLFECLCQPGWAGPQCDECVKYPGCPGQAHCNNPWECLCPSGMDNDLCGVDRNNTDLLPNYFHYEMSQTCVQFNLELREQNGGAGRK